VRALDPDVPQCDALELGFERATVFENEKGNLRLLNSVAHQVQSRLTATDSQRMMLFRLSWLKGTVMVYEGGSTCQIWCPCLLSSDIKDKAVYSKNMVMLGKAKDLEFDPALMKVTHLVVEFEKEVAKELLGKMIVIRHAGGRVPIHLVESIKDAIVLKQLKNELKGSIESL